MLYHGNAMDYIYETPDILQYILENKKEILEDSNRVLKDKKISEIYSSCSRFCKEITGYTGYTCIPSNAYRGL